MSQEELPTELRLSLDWELWVVEQLLFTGKRDDLVSVLAQQGVPRELAAQHVAAIERSEGFARLRRRTGEAAHAARLLRLQTELRPQTDLAVHDDLPTERLLHEHWIPGRPALLRESLQGCQALQWTLSSLAARHGTVPIVVNVDRVRQSALGASMTERLACRWTLAELVAQIERGPSNDFYAVSRNGLLGQPELRPLWDDLAPLPAWLLPPEHPRGVSLWMGPAGTVTPPHFDPHNVLLVQVQGRKRVRLAPRVLPAQHALLEGYYLKGPLEEAAGPVFTVELQPGQALFVPVGWLHEVTALDPSLTLSFLSFPWPNHFHWLGPAGSDDHRSP